ncbi:MAG: hypothetical protein IJ545_04730 [Alphaproteobacteria bacterium]|nr:hypothetical protein [Alphaproteobacteria bacterium]
MPELPKNAQIELEATVSALKDGYVKFAEENKIVLEDLRTFCALSIPTDLSGKTTDLDINKVLIQTGCARVLQRIEYFINTPVEQIIKHYKIGA